MRKMLNYIKSDLYRYAGDTSLKSFFKTYIIERGFNFSVWLRLAGSKGVIGKLAFPIYFYKKRKYGIAISHKMKIGYGLYIGHGGPIVTNPTAVLGNNVNLSQYTTIGSNHGVAANIGDNVYIGPNVCIVESVTIGNNVVIGAGSIVVKDIPSNSTAVGNYAKVVNSNPIDYIGNKWIV